MHPELEKALRPAGKLPPAPAGDGFDEPAAPFNGHAPGDEPPLPAGEADYGLAPGNETPAPENDAPIGDDQATEKTKLLAVARPISY